MKLFTHIINTTSLVTFYYFFFTAEIQVDGNSKRLWSCNNTTIELLLCSDVCFLKHSISTKLYLPRDVTIYKDSFIKCHYSPRLYDKLHQFVLEPSAITISIRNGNNGKFPPVLFLPRSETFKHDSQNPILKLEGTINLYPLENIIQLIMLVLYPKIYSFHQRIIQQHYVHQ